MRQGDGSVVLGGGFGVGVEMQASVGNAGVGVSVAKIGIDFHGVATYTWLIKFEQEAE